MRKLLPCTFDKRSIILNLRCTRKGRDDGNAEALRFAVVVVLLLLLRRHAWHPGMHRSQTSERCYFGPKFAGGFPSVCNLPTADCVPVPSFCVALCVLDSRSVRSTFDIGMEFSSTEKQIQLPEMHTHVYRVGQTTTY